VTAESELEVGNEITVAMEDLDSMSRFFWDWRAAVGGDHLNLGQFGIGQAV
jgi:hypothetical protein